jgi:hypothetical protein
MARLEFTDQEFNQVLRKAQEFYSTIALFADPTSAPMFSSTAASWNRGQARHDQFTWLNRPGDTYAKKTRPWSEQGSRTHRPGSLPKSVLPHRKGLREQYSKFEANRKGKAAVAVNQKSR